MALGKMFEKTIKLVGMVSKVGVQLGANIVGTVAEKIDDNPDIKRRISEYGTQKGQVIKTMTSEVAIKSSNIVDRAVETSMNVLKDGSVRIKDSVSQVAEGINSSIKGMKNYNSQTVDDNVNKSYYASVQKQPDKTESISIDHKRNVSKEEKYSDVKSEETNRKTFEGEIGSVSRARKSYLIFDSLGNSKYDLEYLMDTTPCGLSEYAKDFIRTLNENVIAEERLWIIYSKSEKVFYEACMEVHKYFTMIESLMESGEFMYHIPPKGWNKK